MPLNIPKNILEAALGNGTVRRFRDFSIVVFDGEGALAVPNDIWLPAAAWARSRTPSGNRLRDRFQLLQRLEVLVTRRGTAMVSTTGAHLRLARLRDAMKLEGIDLKEWSFPPDSILDQALNPTTNPVTDADADQPVNPAPETPLDAAPAESIESSDPSTRPERILGQGSERD